MIGYKKWKKLNEDLGAHDSLMGMVRSPNIIGKIMGRAPGMGEDPVDADDQGGIEFSQVDMDNGEDGDSEDVEQICIKHPKYGVVCGERVSGDEDDSDDYEDDSDDYDDDDSGELGAHDDNIEELGEEEMDGPDGDYVEIEDETPMESVKHMKNSKKKCWGKMSKSKSKMNKSKMDDGSDDMDDDMEDTGSAGANMKKKMKSGQEKKKGCYSKKSCGSDKMESRADYLGLPPMNEWRESIKAMLNPNERYDGMNIITEKASKEEHEENEHEEKAIKKGQQAIKRNDMDHKKILAKLKDLYSKLPKSLQKQHKKQCDM